MIGRSDLLGDVAALGEAPQHGRGVDEPDRGSHRAGGSVGSDDHVGVEATTVVQLDCVRVHGDDAAGDRFGAGIDGGVTQPGVEAARG